jgi:ABC-type spermidine/putrescine transport system permease subunit II
MNRFITLSLLRAFVALVFVFLYAPILVIGLMSTNDSLTNSLPWAGFTLRWYGAAVSNRELWEAFANSVQLGVLTAVTSVILATALCLAFREPFRFKRMMLILILLPMLVPSIVHGVSMVLYWKILGLSLTVFGSTFVGHVTYVLPFVFMTIFPRVHRFDVSLEEAARDLGATELMVFRKIVLPLIAPGVVSGALLAFTMSFDEFIRAFLLASDKVTLPMYLWSMVTNDLSPQPNAISSLVAVFSLVLLALWVLIQRRSGAALRKQ